MGAEADQGPATLGPTCCVLSLDQVLAPPSSLKKKKSFGVSLSAVMFCAHHKPPVSV